MIKRILPRRTQEFKPQRSKYLVLTQKALLIISFPALLVVSTLILIKSGYFNVNTIDCTHDYQPCSDPFLLAELQKSEGFSIFQIDTSALEFRITSAKRTVGKVVVKKVYPSTLEVEIFTRSPKVAVTVKNGIGGWVVFSEDYVVLRAMDTDPNVPTVYVSSLEGLSVGEYVSDVSLTQSLKLAMTISDLFIKTKAIELTDYTITITLLDGKTVLMSTRKDIADQLTTLQQILATSTIIQDKNIIDIRFNQPVLK